MDIIRFSVNNRLLVNLILLAIVMIGTVSWYRMPREIFPNVQLDIVRLSTIYEGAAPEAIEAQVTLVLEKLFENNRDVDYIVSLSQEGRSDLYIRLNENVDLNEFIEEARTLVDSSEPDLPADVEKPMLARIRTQFPVISVSLSGELSDMEQQRIARTLQKRLEKLAGVANAGISGYRETEIHVLTDPHQLAALGIDIMEIQQGVRRHLLDRPGGSIRAAHNEIRLRGRGETNDLEAIATIPVRTNDNGHVLRLGDIADIEMRLEEPTTLARYDGRPSINLTVTKTEEASTIEVARLVRELVADMRAELPANTYLGLHTDMSRYVQTRLTTVKSSGLLGLILLLASLCLMINPRVATITALGIPVSFLFAAMGLNALGYTINMVSLFAFLVVLGMVVDDAIIITENIYRHIENGVPRQQACIDGAREVAAPVITATFTTIAAFLPMFAIGSTIGLFIHVIPIVVGLSLIGSLLEAFLILPAHASYLTRPPKPGETSRWTKASVLYRHCLSWCLDQRYAVIAATFGLLLVSVSYAATRLPYQMFGSVETGQIILNIEAPATWSLENTYDLSRQVEERLSTLVKDDEIDSMLSHVGVNFIDFQRFNNGPHLLQMVIELEKPRSRGLIEKWISPLFNWEFSTGTRERDTEEISRQIKTALQSIPGVQRFTVEMPEAGPAGKDIELGILGADDDQLRLQAEEIEKFLRSIPGINEIRHDQGRGKKEIHYRLNETGRRLGLTQDDINVTVQAGYLGKDVAHVTWNNERIPVRVLYKDHIRNDARAFDSLPVTIGPGRTIYLSDVADIEQQSVQQQRRRRDGQRIAQLTADVDTDQITALAATQLIQNEFTADKGYDIRIFGEKKAATDAFNDFYNALLITIVLIFVMLVALFGTLSEPLLIMMSIPFGLIGVIVGHAIFRLPYAVFIRHRHTGSVRHYRQRFSDFAGVHKKSPRHRPFRPRGDSDSRRQTHASDYSDNGHHLYQYLAADIFLYRSDGFSGTYGSQFRVRPRIRHRADTAGAAMPVPGQR